MIFKNINSGRSFLIFIVVFIFLASITFKINDHLDSNKAGNIYNNVHGNMITLRDGYFDYMAHKGKVPKSIKDIITCSQFKSERRESLKSASQAYKWEYDFSSEEVISLDASTLKMDENVANKLPNRWVVRKTGTITGKW